MMQSEFCRQKASAAPIIGRGISVNLIITQVDSAVRRVAGNESLRMSLHDCGMLDSQALSKEESQAIWRATDSLEGCCIMAL